MTPPRTRLIGRALHLIVVPITDPFGNGGNLQQLHVERLAAGLSAQTVVHLHRFLHRVLGQAMRWGQAPRNVAELVDPPRVDSHEFVTLTADQARRQLDAARGVRLHALHVLALHTAMRQGELLGLRWDDLDQRSGALHIRRSLQLGSDGRRCWPSPRPPTPAARSC